jgi:hypothetical protein
MITFNWPTFKEKFNLTDREVEEIIENKWCEPTGYRESSYKDQVRRTKEKAWTWNIEAVEKYERFLNHAKDKHLHFYRLSMAQIGEMKQDLKDYTDRLDEQVQILRLDIASLKSDIEKKEIMVDLKYIGEEIGYSTQTLINSMDKDKNESMVGRLSLPLYSDLIFHKIKNKWQTPLQSFLEVRRRITSELLYDERKRKGIAKDNLIVTEDKLKG